ncbi:STAS domain-containing protein [Streptomyces sp. NPDC057445]|uniref:STAS domain-containing protein n=1 Tax=Streptomyces sp. NPDC057445 TaxID=3346136 RepID=UPI0036843B89
MPRILEEQVGVGRAAARPVASSPQGSAALEVSPLTDKVGLRAAGEVSLSTRTVWERELERLVGRADDAVRQGDGVVGRGGDVYLELSGVTFVDVAGASVLALAAQRLHGDRRMVLDQPPPALRRALDLFWPDAAAIEVTKC